MSCPQVYGTQLDARALPAPDAVEHQHVDQRVPLDALVLQRLTDQRQVGGLVVVRHRRVCHRRRGIAAGVERNQMLADGVFHNGGNHMVVFQHRFAGKVRRRLSCSAPA